jgi:hypothetical protein
MIPNWRFSMLWLADGDALVAQPVMEEFVLASKTLGKKIQKNEFYYK